MGVALRGLVPQSASPSILRLGTRGSPLALAQARLVQSRIAAAQGIEPGGIAIEVIQTSGDRIRDLPLTDAGGKGLFTKEIEEALAGRRIDLAVHSAKVLPPGLELAAFLPREDARDVFVSIKAKTLLALPPGARVGTASLRRQALVRRLRPDLHVEPMRGNVDTRLRKINDGVADGTILALAGLKRLGLQSAAASIFEVDEFLPAVGQGVIAIEIRADDAATRAAVAAINDASTATAFAAERAFLAALDGSCRTPIAGHATVTASRVRFRGLIVRPDGSELHETTREGPVKDAAALGTDAGRELRSRGGPDFFAGP